MTRGPCLHPDPQLGVTAWAGRELKAAVVVCSCGARWELGPLQARHDADAAPVTLPGSALRVLRGGALADVMPRKVPFPLFDRTQHLPDDVA